MTGAVQATERPDAEVLGEWLRDALGCPVTRVVVEQLPGGYANGAWRLDVTVADDLRQMVLKAPRSPSVVYRLDPCREARVVAGLGRQGAPVPAVLAIDTGTRVMGRPCFVMDFVDGRSVPDAAPGGYHGPGWFRDADARAQRAVWDSFHDALGAVHRIDPTSLAEEYDGPSGAVDVLGYWRDALLDVVTAEQAPRQVAMFDWLAANIPPSAEEPPALCMGDARLVNGVVVGPEVRALVDFEVAYVGNPVADVGYSLFLERTQRGQRRHAVARRAARAGDVGALEPGDRSGARRSRLLDGVRRGRDRRDRDAGDGAVGPGRPVRRGGERLGPRMGVGDRPGGVVRTNLGLPHLFPGPSGR